MSSSRDELVLKHLKHVRLASCAAWFSTVALLYLSALLPLFDSSPNATLVENTTRNRLVHPLLRWDAFHFVHIAQKGYVYEHEWAFLPGIAFIMSYPARLLRSLRLAESSNGLFTISDLLAPGALLSTVYGSSTTLYHLTLHHFESPSVAYLTALLSLLPSSPATFYFSVYNEPFFTYLSYRGMLSCARKNLLGATLFFTLAACLRSNGFMLAGFILWEVIAEPVLKNKKTSARYALLGVLATVFICLPFAMHQYSAYQTFCTQGSQRPPWCSTRVPSVYSYVQAKYWNSGFLRYWTLAQLPNILLAMPILLSVLSFTYLHFSACIVPALLRHPLVSGSSFSGALNALCKPNKSTFLKNSITPHIIHSFIMCNILLFAAHTQIALRLAASMPTTYWAAARLIVDYPRIGKWWVGWSVIWGAVSVVLWAVFLPPA